MRARANLKASIELRFGSQRAFAQAVRVHHIRVNRIVKGWESPTVTERERFAKTLDADQDWLFREFAIPSLGAKAGAAPQ